MVDHAGIMTMQQQSGHQRRRAARRYGQAHVGVDFQTLPRSGNQDDLRAMNCASRRNAIHQDRVRLCNVRPGQQDHIGAINILIGGGHHILAKCHRL